MTFFGLETEISDKDAWNAVVTCKSYHTTLKKYYRVTKQVLDRPLKIVFGNHISSNFQQLFTYFIEVLDSGLHKDPRCVVPSVCIPNLLAHPVVLF